MSVRLSDLSACFEGVIPSIIATAAADGMPNVSYLSHVMRVDDDHVALSNQFFAKTAANVRANPQVTLVLVDGMTGAQHVADIRFVRSVDSGPLFDRIALQLRASSAQVGMAGVMRLKSADIFRVLSIASVPSPVCDAPACLPRPRPDLPALASALGLIDRQAGADEIIESLLDAVRTVTGYDHALVLDYDSHRACLTTTGSMGYARSGDETGGETGCETGCGSGIGSEIPLDDGLIGAAATHGRTIKLSDTSRLRRLGQAIAAEAQNNTARSVPFPRLPAAMSQIAVPMTSRGTVTGVLFVESPKRLAFRDEDEAALTLLACQAATALRACEREAASTEAAQAVRPPLRPPPRGQGRTIRVAHHRYDDSVFVDGVYIVKGVAGALLRLMLDWHIAEGRTEFTNREMRLAAAGRLPDFKDNLETRLLLLRRRLDEKQSALRLVRVERGRVRLDLSGTVSIDPAQGATTAP